LPPKHHPSTPPPRLHDAPLDCLPSNSSQPGRRHRRATLDCHGSGANFGQNGHVAVEFGEAIEEGIASQPALFQGRAGRLWAGVRARRFCFVRPVLSVRQGTRGRPVTADSRACWVDQADRCVLAQARISAVHEVLPSGLGTEFRLILSRSARSVLA